MYFTFVIYSHEKKGQASTEKLRQCIVYLCHVIGRLGYADGLIFISVAFNEILWRLPWKSRLCADFKRNACPGNLDCALISRSWHGGFFVCGS